MAGRKDITKLVKKVIINTKGHKQTVYVKTDDDKTKGVHLKDSKYSLHNQPREYTKIFKDKDGTEHLVYLDNSDGGYLIKTEVVKNLRFADRTDRDGNKGYYLGAIPSKDGMSGYLFLSTKKGQDYYTADAGRMDALWTMEKYRRKGVATAMHKFAKDVLKIKVNPAQTLTDDSRGFYGVDENKEFNDWFKGSKAANSKGEPLTLYHGSPDVRGLKRDGVFKTAHETMGVSNDNSYYFTDSHKVASSYADSTRAFDYQNAVSGVVPINLSLKNPLEIDAKKNIWRKYEIEINGEKLKGTKNIVKYARKNGYDGIIVKNVKDNYNNTDKTKTSVVYVVFKSDQIKILKS